MTRKIHVYDVAEIGAVEPSYETPAYEDRVDINQQLHVTALELPSDPTWIYV